MCKQGETDPVQASVTTANQGKKKKNSKYINYESAPADAIYFLFDVETTGSKRNYDRVIAISFLAYDHHGNLLGHFSRMINPGGVRIASFLTKRIHSKFVT